MALTDAGIDQNSDSGRGRDKHQRECIARAREPQTIRPKSEFVKNHGKSGTFTITPLELTPQECVPHFRRKRVRHEFWGKDRSNRRPVDHRRRRRIPNPAITVIPAQVGSGTFVKLMPFADCKSPGQSADWPRLCENDVKSSALTVPS